MLHSKSRVIGAVLAAAAFLWAASGWWWAEFEGSPPFTGSIGLAEGCVDARVIWLRDGELIEPVASHAGFHAGVLRKTGQWIWLPYFDSWSAPNAFWLHVGFPLWMFMAPLGVMGHFLRSSGPKSALRCACGYDLIGSEGRACPECGRAPGSAGIAAGSPIANGARADVQQAPLK